VSNARKVGSVADAKFPARPPDPLAVEVGRIAKLFALYMLKDVDDEKKKVTRLKAVGFSAQEIADLLDKTEENVRVQISQAKTKKRKKKD
jgi:DNA-directed RNA polymerase specialized sigma24 family protein